jgi:BirA family transcriptional regulator, biotin operon repressor / biotin---[acetyl-CoA-carboxylase] ligase
MSAEHNNPHTREPAEVVIVRELLAAGDGFVSGNRVAGLLGMSRVAIWGHVERLRTFGYEIEAVRRMGYRLKGRPATLDEFLLRAWLLPRHRGVHIAFLPSVDSTNSEAERKLAAEVETPLIVIARTQERGRGRLGRRWESNDCGNLYVSFAFRPQLRPVRMQDFTLWMGVNVCEALANACQLGAGVKWPNDILYADRKLGGMLTEARIDADHTRDVVFGLGLNLNSQRRDWPPEVAARATSVAEALGRPVDINHTASAILNRVLSAYERFVADEYRDDFTRLWERFDLLRGRRIGVLFGRERIEGVADGIDANGALRLRDDRGQLHRCLAGDVTIEKKAL